MARPCEQVSHGRRHIRAGSVHVSELIRNQPLPFELPTPEVPTQVGPPAAESTPGLDGLLDPIEHTPTSHRRPVSKAAQAAKIAGLGVASCALCVSIAYGSMITHERREQGSPETTTRPTMDISGEQALLPDRLNSVVPKGGVTGLPQLPGPATNATGAIDNPGPSSNLASPPAHQNGGGDAGTSKSAELSNKDVVEKFYRLVPTWPAQAFTLLDSTLLGTSEDQFVRSWSTVTGLEVIEVSERDGNVFAIVRLRLADGSHLRVQQLLDVANTTPKKIVGAEILSAQRN